MKSLILMLALLSTSIFALSVDGQPSLTFTGYKFTEKAGVSGTFKDMKWSLPAETKDIKELLMGTSVRINSYSVDAGKTARNKNITKGLFKNWGNQYIDAKVLSVDEATKKATLEIKVGDSVNKKEFDYVASANEITLKGSIDLIEMGFKSAFDALSKVCGPLHRGKDGVVKTWSDVALEIKAKLK